MELELTVSGTLPAITSNFDALKAAISQRLEAYKIQVTEENLAQAKKDATELGKAATQLNKMKTAKAAEFSAPVEAFKAQVMELVKMITDGQEFIKKQVAVFEDKTRAKCLEEMTATLKGGYLSLGVRPDFQTGFPLLSDLVGISKITAKGELTKAAKDQVMAIAQAGRGNQDMVDGRIARLEADCFKAGLKTPLQKEHVAHLLLASDETYQAGFQALIKIETERQEKTLRQEKERMEREAKEKAEREAREAQEKAQREVQAKEQKPVEPAPLSVPATTPINLPPGQKRVLSVVVRYQIETAKPISEMGSTVEYFRSALEQLSDLPKFTITIEGDK